MITFKEFAKIPRLNREIVVTEKIDGTNAANVIEQGFEASHQPGGPFTPRVHGHPALVAESDGLVMFTQSRSKFITPDDDNHGFAAWAKANAAELLRLGPGAHFGEWWGPGINKRYSQWAKAKKFSLFNTARWSDAETRPACCDVVPVLYQGTFSQPAIDDALAAMVTGGSIACPGCLKPGRTVDHEGNRV